MMTNNKPSQQNKSALTTPPVALIFLFSNSISYHWERGEGRVILLGQIIAIKTMQMSSRRTLTN